MKNKLPLILLLEVMGVLLAGEGVPLSQAADTAPVAAAATPATSPPKPGQLCMVPLPGQVKLADVE